MYNTAGPCLYLERPCGRRWWGAHPRLTTKWHATVSKTPNANAINTGSGLMRSTIEVAHFFSNGLWMTRFLTPKSSEYQSCVEKWLFLILVTGDYSSGCHLIFAKVSMRLYGALPVGSLRKNMMTSIVEYVF